MTGRDRAHADFRRLIFRSIAPRRLAWLRREAAVMASEAGGVVFAVTVSRVPARRRLGAGCSPRAAAKPHTMATAAAATTTNDQADGPAPAAGLTDARSAALCAKMAAMSLAPPPPLNHRQQDAKELILSGESIFVTGAGGTGKTVLLRDVCEELERRGKIVAVTASTGIAALAIEGTTLHAALGCGVAHLTTDFTRKPSTLDKKRLQALDVLVVDEISMVSGEFLDRSDERLREIRGAPDVPFGGVQLLAIGDFLQLPPVSGVSAREKSRKGFCPALFLNRGYAFQARVWQELEMKTHRLTVKRQAIPHHVFVSRDGSGRFPVVVSNLMDFILKLMAFIVKLMDFTLKLVLFFVDTGGISPERPGVRRAAERAPAGEHWRYCSKPAAGVCDPREPRALLLGLLF